MVQFFKKGRLNFSKNKAINFLLALLVQAIWSQLEDLSFLIILSIISMNIPGMALVIQNTLLNLLYFDLLFTEEWMPDLWNYFGLDFDQIDDNPLNGYFSENGFESTLFIKNIGSTLIFVLLYMFTWIVLFLMKISMRKLPLIEKFYTKLKSHLIWNGSISFLNAQFSIFIMSSMINMTLLKFDDKVQILSSIMTLMTIIVCLSANLSIFIVTRKEKLPENCSQLEEDLKRVSFYPGFQLLRQLVTTLVLVLLREMHSLQVGLMLIISLGHQFYLSRNQVHVEKSKHYITLFNEIIGVSLYIYGLIALLNNENNNFQEGIGWFLASIITGVVAINVAYTFIQIIIKKKNQYCKRKKSTKTVRVRAERQKEVSHTMITQNFDDSIMVVEDYDSNHFVDKSNAKQSTFTMSHEESKRNNL